MSTKPLQILLVEDDAGHIELIRRAFAPEGKKFKLTVAGTLAEARKILKKAPPGLMIVDYKLPDGEGTELLPGDMEKRTLPIVILTGQGDEKVAAAAMKAGAMDYIVKSDETLAGVPHIIERTLREWRHITERKQIEEALRESEERSRAWLEHSPVCTKIVDLDFNLKYMSASGVKDLKIDDVTEFYGKPYPFDFYPEPFRNLMTGNLEKVKETGEVIAQEASVLDIKGNELWYHSTLVPVNDNEGRIDYIIVVSIETTARKQAEKLLKQRERQQEVISELGLDALKGLELDALLQKTTDILVETLEVEYCKVLELQPNGKALLLRAGAGWKEGLVGHATVDAGVESQAGYTLKSDHPVIVKDLRTETRFSAPPLLLDHGVVSGMSVIIRGAEQPWGILGTHIRKHRAFSEDDINFIQSAANVLGLAIGRKHYEEELHQFERIVSTSTDMLALLDKDFIYLAANPAYLAAFNKAPGELIGHSAPTVFGEEFFNDVIRPNAERCLAGNEINYQAWFDFPVYGPRYMDIHYYPYTGAGNEVVGFVVNGRNITKRKQTEETLLKERKQTRQIIETARDAFVCMDADGIITDWNSCAEDVFGWSRKEALGCLVAETIIPEELREAHENGLKHYLATGEGPVLSQHVEITARHRDGHIIPVELSIVPSKTNGGTNFNAFIRDISARKKAKEALEKSREQLRMSLIGTVVAVSRAVGARDPYTAGHQQRVSQLSRAIAQEMGMDKERIDGLRMGASIHDIGKIYLPAEILSKPAKLSELEYKLVQSHAQVGYDILKDVAFPWPVADIAHQHHEHLDGSGYPQGLKGDEICLEARIVAVADVVEAIASHRPYRPSLGTDAALQEIESKRGQFYDPDVVDACVRAFADGFAWPVA